MNVPRHVVVLAAVLLAANTSSAQNTQRKRADSLVTAALAVARAGDTTEAIKLLDKARKTDDKNATAAYQYGLLLAHTTAMGFGDIITRQRAVSSLNHAIDLDGNNAWAYLELGKLRLKMPFMRLGAETSFQRALDIAKRTGDNNAIAEINFEIGQIYDRRYRTMADRHQIMGNANILNPLEAQYTPQYVEDFLRENAVAVPDAGELDGDKAEGYYRETLRLKPGHEEAAASFAAILYDRKRYREMAAVTREAVNASPNSSRIRLALGLALYRLRDYKAANVELEMAVTLMTDRERNMVASLGPIVRPAELGSYDKMDAESRAAFDNQYWKLRDPLYLTPLNEERLAFLARVSYADLFFTTPPDPVIRGALTNRGEIILRYGEPPVVATFAPDVQNKNDGESIAKVTTLWWYPESGLRFVFVGPPAMSTAIFAGDFASYAKDLAGTVPVHFDHLADDLHIDTIPVQIARFRGTNAANTRVEVHADVPTNKLTDVAGVMQMPIETGFMIFDPARNMLVDVLDTVTVKSGEQNGRIRSWDRQFKPGEYGYSIEALEPQAMRSARARGALTIGAFPAGQFALSDVLVGTALENPDVELRRREDLHMRVVPENALDPGQPLALYWESYGAKPDSNGTVHLQVEVGLTVLSVDRPPQMHVQVLGKLADLLRVSAEGERKVSFTYTRTVAAPPASDDRILHALTVELGGAIPAEYELDIAVTDLETGKTAHTSHALRVRRPQ